MTPAELFGAACFLSSLCMAAAIWLNDQGGYT
jgi:hypothetical protein